MTSAVRLGYVVDGVAGAELEPVVLVGALGTTTGMWDGQVGELGRGRAVVRVDLLGHGGSAVPVGPYSLAVLGDAVLGVLDSLGVRRVAFAGVSLGGMVGMWLAAHRAERVARLAVLCSSAYRPPAGNWTDRAAVVRRDGMAGERERLPAVWFTPGFRAARPDRVAAYLEELVATPAEGYASCCEAIGAMDLRPDLAGIAAPTLVVSGADDPASPPEHGRAIAGAVPGARFAAVPEAAHLANVEQPAAVNRLLVDHFDAERGA